MSKNFVPAVLLVLALSVAAVLAYFSRVPDSPWLEEAETLPVIGSAATAFREAYLGPRTDLGPPPEETEEDVEVIYEFVGGTLRPAGDQPARPRSVGPLPRATGGPATSPGNERPRAETPRAAIHSQPRVIADADGRVPGVLSPTRRRLAMPQVIEEWAWAMPGQTIHPEPSAGSEPIVRLSSLACLPVLEREGFWARVRYRGEERWVDTSWTPPHSRRDARQGGIQRKWQPPRNSALSRLDALREMFDLDEPNGRLGPYDLYTDVDDAELIELLGAAAVAAERAYFARYGRLPSGNPLRTAALFADIEDYHRYSAEITGLRTQSHVGHAGAGVLAFYAHGRSREGAVRTLVHEIAHLLNKRSLSYMLPPWLEEGLASDLGSAFVEDDTTFSRPGESVGEALRRQQNADRLVRNLDSDLVYLGELLAAGRLPTVGSVVGADRELFYERGNVAVGYAYGAGLVRYFLDGGHAGGFRRFLGRIADGYSPNAALLTDSLGFGEDAAEGLQAIDQGFRAWLAAESTRARNEMEAQLRAEIERRYGQR